MSTIRRSSRRTAAKTTTTETITAEAQEKKHLIDRVKGEDSLTNKFNPQGQYDINNSSDTNRGRIIRRQNANSSPTSSGDGATTTFDASTSKVATTTTRKREATVSPDSSNSNHAQQDSSDPNDHDGKSKKSRKTVSFNGTTETTTGNSESDTSKKSRSAAQLAREQRSLRRQATATDLEDVSEHHTMGITRTKSSSSTSRNRKLDHRVNHKKKFHGSNTATSDTTNVVRVPMLTGTLVLYRGEHPRAVFIRKV